MPRLLPVVLLLALSGCLAMYRSVAGIENPDYVDAKNAAAPVLSCKVDQMTVEDRDWSLHMRFLVNGCGRTVACQDGANGYQCFENPPRLADFGDRHVPDGVEPVSSTVSLMTGCPRLDVRTELPDERDRGTLTAKSCGRTFLCTLSRGGRAECTETHLGAAP